MPVIRELPVRKPAIANVPAVSFPGSRLARAVYPTGRQDVCRGVCFLTKPIRKPAFPTRMSGGRFRMGFFHFGAQQCFSAFSASLRFYFLADEGGNAETLRTQRITGRIRESGGFLVVVDDAAYAVDEADFVEV